MKLAGLLLSCLLALIAALAYAGDVKQRSAAELMDILMWNREPIGGPFELIDQEGKRQTDQDFRGRLMLVYFGFTNCPDVCPTDLQEITLAMRGLGEHAESVQPIFITVDPERDTVSHLREYVRLFDPRLRGLTGSEASVRKVADEYKVYYAKAPLRPGSADYTVDHTAFIYLMDRQGRYLGFFPPGTSADRMIEVIRKHLSEG